MLGNECFDVLMQNNSNTNHIVICFFVLLCLNINNVINTEEGAQTSFLEGWCDSC